MNPTLHPGSKSSQPVPDLASLAQDSTHSTRVLLALRMLGSRPMVAGGEVTGTAPESEGQGWGRAWGNVVFLSPSSPSSSPFLPRLHLVSL